MNSESAVERVLTEFGIGRSATAQPFRSARSFSGVRLWRVEFGDRMYALRQFPAGSPDRERLARIHGVLRHVRAEGLRLVPEIQSTDSGRTFVEFGGSLWELSEWMPGSAVDREALTNEQIAAAMRALAEFHRAVESYRAPTISISPAVIERQQYLADLLAGGARRLLDAVERTHWPEFQLRARRALVAVSEQGPDVAARLAAVQQPTPLMDCIRDVWREHVLFVGERVTGIIDYGAMREESPAADVARLLGSLSGRCLDRWHLGLGAYRQVRPLSELETTLATVLDASGRLLGAMNWVRWVAAEHRQFNSPAAILERLDELVEVNDGRER